MLIVGEADEMTMANPFPNPAEDAWRRYTFTEDDVQLEDYHHFMAGFRAALKLNAEEMRNAKFLEKG